MLTPHEHTRYARHIALPAIGEIGQQRLKTARVLCIGAGGLGCAALTYLAAAGVGTLGVVDDDTVDASNLQRQTLYHLSNLDKPKVDCAKKALEYLNPHIEVIPYNMRLDLANAHDIINDYEVIIDGSDNFRTRYIINDISFSQKKLTITASVIGIHGQCSAFTAQVDTPCYRCVFPWDKDAKTTAAHTRNCQTDGVLATLPAWLGTLQATEAIKYITGMGTSLAGKLLRIDAQHLLFETLTLTRDPACKGCSQPVPLQDEDYPPPLTRCDIMTIKTITVQALHQQLNAASALQLIDVRTPQEHAAYNIGGMLIPLDTLMHRLSEIDATCPIVVYCQAGIRSAKAADMLHAHGYESVYSLAGGVNAWKASEKHLPCE